MGFWDAVDVDQMASEDVPSIVDYVLQTTKAPRLHWVGHSQGGGQLVFALAKKPSLAKQLGSSVLLAPGVHMAHLHVPLLKYMSLFHLDEAWRSFPRLQPTRSTFQGQGSRKLWSSSQAKRHSAKS